MVSASYLSEATICLQNGVSTLLSVPSPTYPPSVPPSFPLRTLHLWRPTPKSREFENRWELPSSDESLWCILSCRVGFCWWGPGANIEDGSSLIIHWSSGSYKRSTNWANQYDIYFGGPPTGGGRGHGPMDP